MKMYWPLALIFVSTCLHSQTVDPTYWQSIGPYGGSIFSLFVHNDSTVLAGSGNGVYCTSNKGLRWQLLPGAEFITHAVGWVGDSLIHTAGMETRNFGASWQAYQKVTEATGSRGSLAFAIDSVGNYYCGIHAYSYFDDIAFISTDRGKSWQSYASGIQCRFITVDPLGNVYWITDGKFGWDPGAITIIYRHPETAQWDSGRPGLANSVNFSLRGGTDLTVYAATDRGLYRMRWNDAIWHRLTGADTTQEYLSCAADTEGNLYGGTRDEGIVVSHDDGVTWEKAAGIPYAQVNDIKVNGRGEVFAAFEGGGVFYSSDRGRSWEERTMGMAAHSIGSMLATGDGSLYVGMKDGGGLFRSTDKGDHWQRTSNTLPFGSPETIKAMVDLVALAKDSSHGYLYAGTRVFQRNDAISSDSAYAHIFRSADDGQTWDDLPLQPSTSNVTAIYVDSPGNVYAIFQYAGVFLSYDFGMSWNLIYTPKNADGGIETAYLDRKKQNLYISTLFSGSYKYSIRERDWQKVTGIGLGGMRSFSEDASGRLYIATASNGVHRSTDQGVSWQFFPRSDSGRWWNAEWSYLLSNVEQDHLYVHYVDALFESTNGGEHWDLVETTYNAMGWIRVLYIDPESGYGYKGIDGYRGLYRTRDRILAVAQPGKQIPSTWFLSQNYPNPFNPQTTISFFVPQESFVTVEVFNLLGQSVGVLVQEKKAPGSYTVHWDAGKNASGMYFYKITAGKFTDVKKMILVR